MKAIALSALVAAFGILATPALAQDRSFTDAGGFQGRETPGGYEPVNAPLPASTPANARVIERASLSPSTAFPPPAPAKSYPPCSSQRQDGCTQRH